MRQAGVIANEADARRFVDYLLTLQIEAKAEPTGDQFAIWIREEADLARGKQELQAFLQNPADARYVDVAKQADALRKQTEARNRAIQRNMVDVRHRWSSPAMRGPRPVTFMLIGISVLVVLITNVGKNMKPIDPYLFMTAISPDGHIPTQAEIERVMKEFPGENIYENPQALARLFNYYDDSLPEIRHGQLWRLITPIFIHMSWMHLLFNMWMLFVLGGTIEDRFGSGWFLALVLLTAVISNLTQFAWKGPIFGGMSGVNYALFGYIWMKSKFDPMSGLYISERDVFLMLVWFVVCFTGWLGPVANGAHAGGLISGAIIGYAPRWLRR